MPTYQIYEKSTDFWQRNGNCVCGDDTAALSADFNGLQLDNGVTQTEDQRRTLIGSRALRLERNRRRAAAAIESARHRISFLLRPSAAGRRREDYLLPVFADCLYVYRA